MTRSLLVAVDGSPAARSALRYALDFAFAVKAVEIAGVSVREMDHTGDLSLAHVVTTGEPAVVHRSANIVSFDDSDRRARPPVDLLRWRSGSSMQRVVERAAGPVAIRAVP